MLLVQVCTTMMLLVQVSTIIMLVVLGLDGQETNLSPHMRQCTTVIMLLVLCLDGQHDGDGLTGHYAQAPYMSTM